MAELWREPWFVAAVAVAVVVPVLLIVLTEIIGTLQRRGHPAVRPLRLARNLVVPAAAILVLLVFADRFRGDGLVLVRIAATVVGFLVILLMLSAFNAALFGTPAPGTWRARLPSIFVDIARLILAVAGLGVLFAIVWNADIGGLLATLGVTSIVLGLALQGAIGSVVSGLLLLFEQPFRLGDVIESGSGSGRVVEVNWRSVHIQSAEGIVIVPNATLAGAVFTNRSRSEDGFAAELTLAFSPAASPRAVMGLLERVGADLPLRRPDGAVTVVYDGDGRCTLTVPVVSAAVVDESVATLREWAWYAARRAGMPLSGTAGDADPALVEAMPAAVALALRLPPDHVTDLAGDLRVAVYAPGETLQHGGVVADTVQVVLAGTVRYEVFVGDGDRLDLDDLGPGDFLGQTALTGQASLGRYTALSEVAVARVPASALTAYLTRVPAFARTIGAAIDVRRAAVQSATAERMTP